MLESELWNCHVKDTRNVLPSKQKASTPLSRLNRFIGWAVELLIFGSTVGAGDTFIAGMLFSLTCRGEWDLDRKLEFANELAGRKVVQEGLRGLGSLMQHAL